MIENLTDGLHCGMVVEMASVSSLIRPRSTLCDVRAGDAQGDVLILGFKRLLAHFTNRSDDKVFSIFLFALTMFSSSHCYDRISETRNAHGV